MYDNRRRRPVPQWRRVALTAVGVLAAAAATTVVVRTGEAATTTELNSPPPTRTVVATAGPPRSTAPPTAVTVTMPVLPPETPVPVVPSSDAPSSVGAAPLAEPMVDPRQIVYTVSGNQRPDDPVTVIYADDTGALRTAENVTLPWTMTVVPDVPVNYVTASSAGSQLNCRITDAQGTTVAAQRDNTISTTCNH